MPNEYSRTSCLKDRLLLKIVRILYLLNLSSTKETPHKKIVKLGRYKRLQERRIRLRANLPRRKHSPTLQTITDSQVESNNDIENMGDEDINNKSKFAISLIKRNHETEYATIDKILFVCAALSNLYLPLVT